MEGSGHPAVVLLCYRHLSLSWNPVTCVQQPKGHLPRCLIDALPTRLKYRALKCPPPSAPICSSLAFPHPPVIGWFQVSPGTWVEASFTFPSSLMRPHVPPTAETDFFFLLSSFIFQLMNFYFCLFINSSSF